MAPINERIDELRRMIERIRLYRHQYKSIPETEVAKKENARSRWKALEREFGFTQWDLVELLLAEHDEKQRRNHDADLLTPTPVLRSPLADDHPPAGDRARRRAV